VKLAGLWQTQSENYKEPSIYDIVSAFGYTTALRPVSVPDQDISALHGKVIPQSRDEVMSAYWQPLDTAQPVTVSQIAAYHGQGVTARIDWFNKGSRSPTFPIFTHDYRDGQTLLPRDASNGRPATSSFRPTSNTVASVPTFGFVVDNAEASDPVLNSQSADRSAGCTGACGNHVRFFLLRGPDGAVIPGQYLMIMDYSGINYDFQDNVYIVSNVRPAPLLINVGGAGYTDPAGQVWQPDADANGNVLFSPSSAPAEPRTPNTYPYPGTVAGTTNPQLYSTYRAYIDPALPRVLTFNVPLGDGTYDVKLHMTDLYWTAPGQRVFSVSVQGSTPAALSNVDLVAQVGPKTALVQTVPGVVVSGGKLSIALTASVDYGALSGFEVLRR